MENKAKNFSKNVLRTNLQRQREKQLREENKIEAYNKEQEDNLNKLKVQQKRQINDAYLILQQLMQDK